ncbi:O-antigen ligase family protein [Thiohalocapsa marina]|uniref:O-antigen ligase family protein n=1 Tax=Thiohalocapsa marina TaxID=424902 RepID=A0A5M8FI99_9GAMM|nr:O-antigen ligase family protein [Thiohalocapsa marina]KAA6184643.1 O-antigen ligase family protein [Thiohalocapsa marina]
MTHRIAQAQTLGLYLLALSLFLIPAGVSAALVLLWAGFFALLLTQRPLPGHAAVWIALGFVCYCLLQIPFERYVLVTPDQQLRAGLKWIQLAFFVPVAYALRGDQRLLLRLLLLALCGLLLGMVLRGDWALMADGFQAWLVVRPGFGFTAIAFALYSGTALIGMLVLYQRCWRGAAGGAEVWRVLLWLVGVLVLLQGVVVSLSRASWLALLLTLLLGGWLTWRDRERQPGPAVRARFGWLVIAALMLAVVLNGTLVRERMSAEVESFSATLAGAGDTGPATSLGLRWHAQQFGLQRWLERPVFGWGPGASRPLMESSGHAGLRSEPDGLLQHLHNSYLEILVQLGAVGLAFFAALFLALLWSVRQATAAGRLDRDVARFLILAFVFVALWSLFNFRALNQDWRAYWGLLAGAMLAFSLWPGRARMPEVPR